MKEETKWLRCADRNGKPCKACDEVISAGKGITELAYLRMVDEYCMPTSWYYVNIIRKHGEAHREAWKKYYKFVEIEKDGKKDFIIEDITT